MEAIEKITAIRSSVDPFDIYAKIPELNLALNRQPAQVPDPKTGKGNTVFRIAKNGFTYLNGVGYMDVIDTVAYVLGKTKMQAVSEIQRLAGINLESLPPSKITNFEKNFELSPEEAEKRFSSLRKLYGQSMLGSDSYVVKNYLKQRGLENVEIPPTIRFVKSCFHAYKDDSGEWVRTYHPAMLGVFFDPHGKPICLHRIYLARGGNGKADVPNNKKLMAPPVDIRGGAIRLDFEVGEVLALAEGIETAFAVRDMTGLPTWACYSNTLLEQVQIPKSVKRVFIYADKDAKGAGQESAEKLRKVLESKGIEAKVHIPKLPIPVGSKGVDWLDVYNHPSKVVGF